MILLSIEEFKRDYISDRVSRKLNVRENILKINTIGLLLLLALLSLLTTSSAFAFSIESYTNIKINPVNSRDYRAVVSVHLKWQIDGISQEENIAAREAIAIALKSLKTSELTGQDSIEVTKRRISTYIAENDIVGSNKIIGLYITDLIVEYTGESKAYLRKSSRKTN